MTFITVCFDWLIYDYFCFSVWNTWPQTVVHINVIDVNDISPQFIFPVYPSHSNADVADKYFAIVTSDTKADSLVTNVIRVSAVNETKIRRGTGADPALLKVIDLPQKKGKGVPSPRNPPPPGSATMIANKTNFYQKPSSLKVINYRSLNSLQQWAKSIPHGPRPQLSSFNFHCPQI